SWPERLPRLPNDQKIYCCNFAISLKYESTLTIAAVILPNIRPIINSAIVSLTLDATVITAKSTKKLPKLAAMAKEALPVSADETIPPKIDEPIIKIATPRLAPELIPSTNGPASGFLNCVCIKSPLKASPLPVRIACTAFGTRKFCIIYAHDSFSVSPPNNDHSMSLNGIETDPRLIL